MTFEVDVPRLMIISETYGKIVSFGFNPQEETKNTETIT